MVQVKALESYTGEIGVRISILRKKFLKDHFSCIYMWLYIISFVDIYSETLIYSCYKTINRNQFVAIFLQSEKWDRPRCFRTNVNYFMGPSTNTKK